MGAFIDLHTGLVYLPPKTGITDPMMISGGFVEPSGDYIEFNKSSRLLRIRRPARDRSQQEVQFFVWENNTFRQLGKWVEPKEP